MKSISDYKEIITKQLADSGAASPGFDAKCIIAEACGCELSRLPLCYAKTADEAVAARINELCSRRCKGEPLQYILGKWEFMSLPFYVGYGVLIPSPDTEILAQTVIKEAKKLPFPRVLDLCAGSGCIGISVASYVKDANITLVELYPSAYNYLVKNIELNNVSEQCLAVNADALSYESDALFDIVVCNPPYVSSDEMHTLSIEVKAQPETALTDGGDGLSFYRRISENAAKLLKSGGMLAFEVGYTQSEAVESIMKSSCLKQIETLTDYSGIKRVVKGIL